MRKFVVLLVLVGLFSSCSMKATESEEQLNLLKDLKEVYYEDNRKGEIKLLGNLYVNLDDFFQLSEKEQIQKAQELEKELKLEQQRWFSERGIDYDLNDSDDEKSRKIKKQSLQQSLPSEALNQIEEAEKIDNNEYIQKIKELMFYVIPDDEKLKYRLKENRMLLMKYSPILSPDEHEKLFEDSYGNGTMTVDKKLKSGGEMIDEDIKTIQKDVMGFKNKSTNLVMNKSFDEIEKISDNNIIEIKKIIQKKDYKINHLTSSYMEHTVLYNAIQKGNLKLVKVLVENGADLNIKDRNNHTPIYYASQFAYKHIVDYLIEQQNIDLSIGEPLIGSIVNYNDFQLIDKCLEKGLKIDSKNSFGNTPLILAIYNDAKLKTIRYLVSKGADIYALTEENKNILEVAEKANKKKVYDYLKTIYKSEENEKFVNSEDKVLNTINKQHKFSIEHLFVTKDEKRFITVDAKDTIRVFDLNKGILLKKFTVDAERGIVDVKLFNNKLLVSSSYDVRLIDLNNIHNITIFRETIEKNKIMHKKSYINSVDISPNGKQIVISRGNLWRDDEEVHIWDVQKSKIIQVITSTNTHAVKYLDNNIVVLGNNKGMIRFWNIEKSQLLKHFTLSESMVSRFYKNEKYLFIIYNSRDNPSFIDIVNIADLKQVGRIKIDNYTHTLWNISSLYAIDDKIAIGLINGGVYVSDINKTQKYQVQLIGIHKNEKVKDLCFLPKKNELISVGRDGLKKWKL